MRTRHVPKLTAGTFYVFPGRTPSPDIGSLRDDLMPSLRMFTPKRPASNYIIFYYVILDGIEVSDVIHGARDWVTLFSRGERGRPTA